MDIEPATLLDLGSETSAEFEETSLVLVSDSKYLCCTPWIQDFTLRCPFRDRYYGDHHGVWEHRKGPRTCESMLLIAKCAVTDRIRFRKYFTFKDLNW